MPTSPPPYPVDVGARCTLEDILKTKELATRPSRPPNYQRESAALVALARHMATTPETILQKLTDTAMALCRAESAGMSLEDDDLELDVFRWRAVSGRLRPFLGGTMSRHFSPCATTLEHNAPQLMVDAERYYGQAAGLDIPLRELLLVPFYRGGRAVGTLWLVSHEETGVFDAEDVRLMTNLSEFASAAVETLDTLAKAEKMRFQLEDTRVKLESALKAGGIATWDWNIAQNRVQADAYCAALFSLSPEEAAGAPVERFVESMHPDDRQRVQDTIAATVRSGEVYEVEYRLITSSSEYLWVIARGRVLRNPQGEAIHMAGVVVDITERKEAQLERERKEAQRWENEREINAALREARDQALAASRAKDDFLAALSHELRTPLNPVLMLASDLAENADLPPELRADFETVRKNVELEARLIDDLLDLTRITTGKLKLDTIPVDFHAIARDAEEKVAADAHDKNITIEWKLGAERSAVAGDPVRLQQVCWNVLKNAVKFTPHGGRILVESRNAPDSTDLCLEVHDSGIGISAEELPTIFDAFAQGAHGGSHVFGGLGLGLAISQRIMEMHGGRIVACSEGSGHGSCFSIQMPATGQARKITDKVHLPETGGKPATFNLLLVEDHVPTRQILERLLTRRGHLVTTAGSGKEALQHVRERAFDLAVCDVGLPDTDGHTLLQELRQVRPALPAIAMTGYGTEHDVQKSDAAGFLMHLTKPVSIATLEEALRTVRHPAAGE